MRFPQTLGMKEHPATTRPRPRRRGAGKLAAAGLFLTAVVWQHVEATRLGYQVERSRKQISTLRCAQGALQTELEDLLSPYNLSAQAHGRLGMVLVSPASLRRLDDDTMTAQARPGLLRRLLSRTRRDWQDNKTAGLSTPRAAA